MTGQALLTLNAGSSSFKFSVYTVAAEPEELLVGQVESLGPAARMKVGGEKIELGAADHGVALQAILRHAGGVIGDRVIAGVGHRIAHGGLDYAEPRLLDDETMAKLRSLEPLAPLHQPHNLNTVDAAKRAFPDALQIACFDTAFHRGHPWVNDTFAVPRELYEKGVRRYGFHGLSYNYVTGRLAEIEPDLAAGRVIICHLGSGASMCAVKGGKSIASTMGFSALDGLPMGTRCGQLDPGILLYLMDTEKMTSSQITELLYKECGLKGLSGISNDMRTLEDSDAPEAAQAIDYFVFRVRRELGALAATLCGVDAVVFCGGIGENSVNVRARVCEGMEWIGIELDPAANDQRGKEGDIGRGKVRVMVIPTDEERVIARATSSALMKAPELADA